ncbi:hypothetical protein [Vulgatibacter incomptus]|uniref:hypothetical protein n=1 Tax=Vulgatibacter incomptus TaxID=1391653 RepID=UPI0012FC4AA7|nr:hypothetical protein [Vulgatibacter incomptus]
MSVSYRSRTASRVSAGTAKPRIDADAPEPNIAGEFTPWIRWADRLSVPDGLGGHVHEHGGVYLLAHFPIRVPRGPADFLHSSVVYVGEGGHLKSRWYAFQRSALHGLVGHSGGHSHRAWRELSGAEWETLHVAALPIWFESEGSTDAPTSLARRFRLHLEQLLLWKLAVLRRGKKLTLLNAK